jgi:hypothetical protein
VTLSIYLQVVAFILGAIFGAGVAIALVRRWWPRVTVNHVHVAPESIARGIAAGGGIQCNVPAVIVDWNVIYQVVEANGYQLIAKSDAGVARKH